MVSDEVRLEEQRQELLKKLREQFRSGDHDGLLTDFAQFGDIRKVRSGIRVEAISLAARVYAASGSRKPAVKLLSMVWDRPQKSHRLYRYLATACLELGEYRRASELAASAAELVEQERAQKAASKADTDLATEEAAA